MRQVFRHNSNKTPYEKETLCRVSFHFSIAMVSMVKKRSE